MNGDSCAAPIALPQLIDYWLGELAPAEAEAIDEHIIACGECSAHLEELVALGEGVRAAFRDGFVRAFYTPAFVEWLRRRGVRVRSYDAIPGATVNCGVAIEDEVVIARLAAPLAGRERIDVISERSIDPQANRFRDIPFDARAGEIIISVKLALLRRAPAHEHRIRVVSVTGDAEQVIGEYLFRHSPHSDAST